MKSEVRDLVDRATAAGWRCDPSKDGTRLKLLPPGGGLVVLSAFPATPRALTKAIAELRRHGLDIPHAGAKKQEDTTTMNDTPITSVERIEPKPAGPTRADTMEAALEQAIAWCELLADEVAAERKAREELEQRLYRMGADAATFVTKAELKQAMAETALKADPIGAFRARVRGETAAKSFPCSACGKTFDTPQGLGGHSVKVHGGRV